MSRWLCPNGAPRFWAIVLLASVLWGTEYWQRDLWEPDEARYAYVAREMREDGHWLVPHRHGEYYAHKPPLMFWLNNAFATLNGGEINRITTRLPTLLGTILSLWTTGQIAALLIGGCTGWLAPLLLGVSTLFWVVNGMGQIDGLLCGLEMLAFWLLLTKPSSPSKGIPRAAVAYLVMGMAILAKGPVGLIVPYGAWICFILFSGTRQRLRDWHLLWGPMLALLPVMLWLAAIIHTNAAPEGYLNELLFKQNVGRATGDFAKGHVKPFWYFISYFLTDFLPWTLLLPSALLALKVDSEKEKVAHGLLGWLLFVILFFSLSATKRNLYILMAYPAASILLAAGWVRINSLPNRHRQVSQWLLSGLFLLLGSGLILTKPIVSISGTTVPIETGWFIPAGIVLAITGVLLSLPYMRHSPPHCWLASAATGFALTLWLLALLVYPVLNTVKAPYELVKVAEQHLPAGKELLLYRIQGEIQALYCHVRGRRNDNTEELLDSMRSQQHGLIVLHDSEWDEIKDIPGIAGRPKGEYNMGSKTMFWIAFDLTGIPQGQSPL